MTRVDLIRSTDLYRNIRANGGTAENGVTSVRRHWAFIKRLSADVKAHKKRSAAAKRGWRKRKAANREI